MSRGFALVRFPDGDIWVGCYNGTSDHLYARIYHDQNLDRWYDIHKGDYGFDDVDKATVHEPCEIYSDYGGGSWWAGRADRTIGVVTDGTEPYGVEGGKAIVEPRPMHRGHPPWVDKWIRAEEGAATCPATAIAPSTEPFASP